MRALLLLLVAVMAMDKTSGLFIDTIADVFNVGVNFVHGAVHTVVDVLGDVVNTGVSIGAAAIGVVVDPFGWWRPSTDDHGHATGQVVKCPAIADIIFLLDASCSMSSSEFEMARDFAMKLTEHFTIGARDVRIAAATFSDRVHQSFQLGSYTGSQAVSTALKSMAYIGGGTKTYLALDHIRDNRLFSTIYGGRARSSKIVVVLTADSSDDLRATSQAAAALRDTGVIVIGVGIGITLPLELTTMTSDYRHVYQADDFNSLSRIEPRVASGICSIPETEGYIPQTDTGTNLCPQGFQPSPRSPSTCIDVNECETRTPCQHKCVNLPGKFRCSCDSGYVINPAEPTQCKPIRQCTDLVDVIFLLDQSGSIGSENFIVQQRFVAKLTHHFTFGVRGARFGGLLFATDVTKLFDLDTHTSRADVASSLLGPGYSEGGTNTHLAINYIVEHKLFSPASGGRGAAPDVAVVVTDGESSRPEETKQAATRLKAQGTQVVAVGIGDQVAADELAAIASSSEDVFVVMDFDWLDYIEETLTERICPSTRS